MYQAAEPVAAQNPDVCVLRGRMEAPGRRTLMERSVRPVGVVVIDVLIKDQQQVPFPGDQHAVQALAAGAGYPPLGDRIGLGRPDRGLDDRCPGHGEQRVEAAVNLASRSRIRNLKLSA